MASNYDWLPDHHLGAVGALAHADELIAQAGDLLFTYQVESGNVIELREQSDGLVNQLIVESLLPIPRKLTLVVADAMVALRGVLEHTLFAEIEHRDGLLGDEWARLVEMPATLNHKGFEEWRKRRERKGPPSLAADGDVMRAIESLQPFQHQLRPAEHPLARLTVHTNHSKHRKQALAAVLLPVVYREDRIPRSFAELEKRPERPLELGEVIFTAPVGEVAPLSLNPTVGLNRPNTNDWPILMHELRDIADWVRKQAVPRLITCGDLPASELPARFDISLGYSDERLAIAGGSHTSAVSRQTDRLVAASARLDLVDLFGLVPGAPGPEQIGRWLSQLSDKQVIERVDRLEVFKGLSSASSSKRALDVLGDMLTEALDFLKAQ